MNRFQFLCLVLLVSGLTAIASAQSSISQGSLPQTLKDAFHGSFYVGVAINRAQIEGKDTRGDRMIEQQFNSISPENVLKWESVHSKPDQYDFALADKYVAFGEQNHMFIIGHTLVWHNQTPKWVFEDSKGNAVSRDELLRRMRDHIHTVVGRYKGRIKGWDVVNEAVDENGTLRQSPWLKIIGPDYIEKAFQYAHEADPDAELYYNDYNLENEPKRKGAIALIKQLQTDGIRVKAIGLQGHYHLDWPTVEQEDAAITAFETLGLKINISELDITVLPSPTKSPTADVSAHAQLTAALNPYPTGLPDAVQQKLAQCYGDLFRVFMKHRNAIERVTFWGLTDADSWRNDWPVPGRIDYPLIFDRNGTPKPAMEAVLHAADPQQQTELPAYKNSRLPTDERVNDLVSRMTLAEKISQLGHTAQAIPRLGVPEYNWWNEGLHGVGRAGYATVFPQAIGMAATFDEPLLHQIADIISTEFRAKYVERVHPDGSTDQYRGLTVWSPNINIFRDPRWGRGQETYGEDPYLTSRLAVAFVTGLQGDDPKYLKTVATPKHFAVHSGPETTRHSADVRVSKHDMEDTYFPAFRATVTEAKAESVMCAYNSVNGQPACANQELLQRHLRDDWGFHGYVVSDCGAVGDVFSGHHYAKSMEEAVAASFKTGTDLVCGWPVENGVKLEKGGMYQAVQQGQLPESVVDNSLRRLFTARFRLGMFDPPSMVSWSKITFAENDTDAHRQLSLQAARESIVLLKNANHLLPLKTTPKTIAVIGPDADSVDALVGNYNGTPSKPITVLAGIKQRFPNSKIIYSEGVGITGPATEPIPSDALFTGADRHEHGLKGAYFANTKFEGTPSLSRTDATVNFDWQYFGVTPAMVQDFSVRWEGVLIPPTTGDYLIGFTGEDGYRVWLDGRVVAEDWTQHRPATTVTSKLHLEAGHPYPLKVECFQLKRGAEARLIWSILGKPERDALEVARNSDVVIVAMGLSPRVEGEEMKVSADGFAGGDRTKIDLPEPQEKLLEQIYAQGKPVVLVLMGGSALAVNWAEQKLPAILEAWYPGGEGGQAVAEILAGDVNPSGRLPVTFYKSLDELPPFDDYSMASRTYRYFRGEPLYPFGYGLSYTSFAYSNPKVSQSDVDAKGTVSVSVDVKNTGEREGDEVVQLYLTHDGVAGAPIRSLQGIQRVHLRPNESKTVSFQLENRQLRIVDETGTRRVAAGPVEVWIGGGQPSGPHAAAGTKIQFRITGDATLPD